MTTLRVCQLSSVIAIMSLTLSGCAGGGLRNVVSWMRPANYQTLDGFEDSTEADPTADSIIAATDDQPSLRSRLASRLPWNKTVEPDPFLVAEQSAPDEELLDVRVEPEIRTVAAERKIDEAPEIRPEKSTAAVKPLNASSTSPASDADADMEAIEKIIARMDSNRKSAADAEPLFSATDANRQPGAERTGTRQTNAQRAVGMTPAEFIGSTPNSATVANSARLLEQELDSADDGLSAFNRHLVDTVASHDRHAVSGAGADLAQKRAIAPNDFDRLLELDRQPRQSPTKPLLSDSRPPHIQPREKQGVTVAHVHEVFEQRPQEVPRQTQRSRATPSNLIDAVDAFDRNLVTDNQTPITTDAFQWQLPGSNVADELEGAVAFNGPATPTITDDPFGPPFDNFSADAGQKRNAPGLAFADFHTDTVHGNSSLDSRIESTHAPFKLAGSSRTLVPDTAGPPVIRIPPPVGGPRTNQDKLNEDPFFNASHQSLIETAPRPPVAEVTAQSDAPTVSVSTGEGLSTRNVLLLLGGMIVVILLFAPGRKHV